MHESWVAFARDGVAPTDDLPDWPTVDSEGRPVLLFDTENSLALDPHGGTRRFWDTVSLLVG